jgi:hypothetical protein
MEKIVDMTDALKQVREYKKEPEQEKMVITNANKAYQSYKAGDKEHYKAADDLEEQKRQLEEEIKCLSEERDSMIQEKRQEGFAVRYSLDGKRLVQAYKTEKDAEHRAKILKSMGGVKDVSITKHILNFKEEVLDEFTNFKSITFKPKGKYVSDGKYEIVYDHGRKALVTKKQLNVWLKQKFIEIDEELKEGGDERFSQILRIKRAIEIAKKMAGNYTGATKEIEKIAKGLSKEKDVKIALMRANEEKERQNESFVDNWAHILKIKVGDKVRFVDKGGAHFGKKGKVIRDHGDGSYSVEILFPSGRTLTPNNVKNKDIVKEEVLDEASPTIAKVKDIAKNKQAAKIDGTTVDLFTASAISQVYDKVNDVNKKKMDGMKIIPLANIAMKLLKNEYEPVELDDAVIKEKNND